jgi:hypothetical protein
MVIHVAPDGNDAAPGTATAPLSTLGGARNQVRQTLATGKMTGAHDARGCDRVQRPQKH